MACDKRCSHPSDVAQLRSKPVDDSPPTPTASWGCGGWCWMIGRLNCEGWDTYSAVFSGAVWATLVAGAGATAAVSIDLGNGVTYNDSALVARMRPTLARVAGGRLAEARQTTTAEDFSRFQEQVSGMFVFLGVTPENQDMSLVAQNHSPRFFADERALPVGVRLLVSLAVDYLSGAAKP